MIVDDETSIIEQIKSFLKEEKLNIISATTNREALNLLDRLDEDTFDGVLIDSPHPASQNAALYCLKPTEKAKDADSHNYLQKPFTKEQLQNFLRENSLIQ